MRYPDNYWSTVAARAGHLQDKNPKLDGNTAYWLARHQIDVERIEKDRQIQIFDALYPGVRNAARS